jgi:hypothetical protein
MERRVSAQSGEPATAGACRALSDSQQQEAMMDLARYFVFESADGWIVMLDGTPIGYHDTKPEALNSAIVMADLMGSMQYEADVMVEGDGKLAFAWTYGRDEMPPQIGSAA